MTAFFDSAQAIISRFDTQWAAAHPAFHIVHDNQHYEPTEGVDFAYLSVQFTGAHAVSLGGPDTSLIRHGGFFEINFYTALAKGSGLGLQYADEAAALFRLQQFDGVSCGEPIRLAYCWPNLRHHFRMASYETITPRTNRSSSTSR